MDDITRVLEERKRQFAETPDAGAASQPRPEEDEAEGVTPCRFDGVSPLERKCSDQLGEFDSAQSSPTGSGMVLVAAIERPVESEPDKRPVPDRAQIIEALLFAATQPLAEARLREIVGCTTDQITEAVGCLNRHYEASGRAFRIHRVAQGYQLYTLPEYAQWVKGLFKTVRTIRLSRAGLETLAIIAYKQPVTKPEIEQFRGVDASGPLLTLLERKLIVLAGRAHKPGNPFLYRTSREFLRYFGLGSLDDLPRPEELEAFLRQREERAEAEDAALLGTPAGDIAAPIVPLEDAEEPAPTDAADEIAPLLAGEATTDTGDAAVVSAGEAPLVAVESVS